jgi:predicted deacylase
VVIRHEIGESHDGRPLAVEYYGQRGPRVVIIGAIHGDERCTVVFGERLGERLQEGWADELGVRVTFVHVANPDGVALGTRANARGVDLNRNFPADNFVAGADGGPEPLSEPESRALHDLIDDTGPDAIITLHCCEPMFDFDGPAAELAGAMAAAMPDGLDFPVDRLGASPGSLGSWAGADRGIPVVTVEFDWPAQTAYADQYDPVMAALEAGLRAVASGMDM